MKIRPGLSQGEKDFNRSDANLPSPSEVTGRGAGGEGDYRAMASKAMVQIARDLRQRQTDAEELMWEALRNRRLGDLKFRRQHPLANTAYVVDFLCYEAQLVVEIDGGIHRKQVEDDAIRQANIEAEGYRVLRFTNDEVVNNLEDVLTEIVAVANSPHSPHPKSFSPGEKDFDRSGADNLPSPSEAFGRGGEPQVRWGEGNSQLSLWDNPAFGETVREAVGRINSIEQTIADVVGDVKAQAQSYETMFHALEPWRNLAHLWTARHFGLSVSTEQWHELYTAITTNPIPGPSPLQQGREETALDPSSAQTPPKSVGEGLQALLDEALALHEQYHFFHWELAFPEVFFDAEGQPIPGGGFDAVVGNPPYVRMENIMPLKPFLSERYLVHESRADLFLYFYERMIDILRLNGYLGFITSGTFLDSNSASRFRELVESKAGFEKFIDFGAVQPFKGVDMATNVVVSILRRGEPKAIFRGLTLEGRNAPESLDVELARHGYDSFQPSQSDNEWRFQAVEITHLFRKIIDGRDTLKIVADGNIYYGIKTGYNDAFIINQETKDSLINQDKKSSEIIRRMSKGQDLRPYYQSDEGQYLIFTPHGINIEEYPAVKDYLSTFKDKLSKRATSDNHKWFELQQPQMGIYPKFDESKIMYPGIAKFPRYSVDTSGKFMDNSVYFVMPTRNSIWTTLGLLQSRLLWFALSQMSARRNIRDGLWRYVLFTQYVERLPIPSLTPSQEQQLAEYAEEITELARRRYQLHEGFRHRVQVDLGGGDGKLNTRLSEWYDLADFADFRDQVVASFGRGNDVPLRERGDWEAYLQGEQTRHQELTGQIVRLETDLNAVVYAAFKLDADEIGLIEQTTKYPYGAV